MGTREWAEQESLRGHQVSCILCMDTVRAGSTPPWKWLWDRSLFLDPALVALLSLVGGEGRLPRGTPFLHRAAWVQRAHSLGWAASEEDRGKKGGLVFLGLWKGPKYLILTMNKWVGGGVSRQEDGELDQSVAGWVNGLIGGTLTAGGLAERTVWGWWMAHRWEGESLDDCMD